jgi:hypothetical protein
MPRKSSSIGIMSPAKFVVTFNPVLNFQNPRECILYVSEFNMILYYFYLNFFSVRHVYFFLTKNLV